MVATLLCLVLAVQPGPQWSMHSVPYEGSDVLSIELAVPNAWGVVELPPPEFNSRREIQVAVNNRGLSWLRVGPLCEDIGDGMTRWTDGGPEVFVLALSPGTVYLDVNLFSGGPPGTYVPYAWTPASELRATLRRADRKRTPAWETDEVTGYEVYFVHWGRVWYARIAARKPFSQRDLDRAFAVLKSLHLPDVPVLDSRQAIEVVLPYVPDDIRDAALSALENCGCCAAHSVESVPIDGGFRVTFGILDGPRAGKIVKAAAFDVEHNGTVHAREGGQ
ncbi:MAG TPA: hypothetical protein VFX92_02780 [Candidatus Krumholzibacteria bacterium]|nr:hypothetical protein [Candidatus Krumholzibacteria bacterium]